MKKHILKLTVLLLLFSACEKYPKTLCPCGKIEISKKEYIAMCVVPDVVTANSVNRTRIENYTKYQMDNIDDIHLEYFNNDYWENVHFQRVINSAYHHLPAGALFEGVEYIQTNGWLNYYSLIEKYNDSKQGKYRIIKNVTLLDGSRDVNGASGKKHQLVAEFEFK